MCAKVFKKKTTNCRSSVDFFTWIKKHYIYELWKHLWKSSRMYNLKYAKLHKKGAKLYVFSSPFIFQFLSYQNRTLGFVWIIINVVNYWCFAPISIRMGQYNKCYPLSRILLNNLFLMITSSFAIIKHKNTYLKIYTFTLFQETLTYDGTIFPWSKRYKHLIKWTLEYIFT